MPSKKLSAEEYRGHRLRAKAKKHGATSLTASERAELAAFDRKHKRYKPEPGAKLPGSFPGWLTRQAKQQKSVARAIDVLSSAAPPPAPGTPPPIDTSPPDEHAPVTPEVPPAEGDKHETPPPSSGGPPPIDTVGGASAAPVELGISNAAVAGLVTAMSMTELAAWAERFPGASGEAKAAALTKAHEVLFRCNLELVNRYLPANLDPSPETVGMAQGVLVIGGPSLRKYLDKRAEAKEAKEKATALGVPDAPIAEAAPVAPPPPAPTIDEDLGQKSKHEASGGYA